MAERVIIRQTSNFETEILAPDPFTPDSDELNPVSHINDLTPYGMLLASLGSCTAILLHSFAQHHELDLRQVELRIQYERNFKEDCKNCEEIDKYEEHIEQEIKFTGKLTPEERNKLFLVSRHCPIHKILERGIEVKSRLAE